VNAAPTIDLSVVVPAYNESASLSAALTEIATALDLLGRTWEIVVVDDGSEDDTVAQARKAAAQRPGLQVVANPANLGIGGALRQGILHSTGTFVTIVPADIAFDLARLGDMLREMENADVLVCLRSDRQDSSLFRKVVSHVYIGLIRSLFSLPLQQFNYIHVYRRSIFTRAMFKANGVFFHAEVLIRARDAGYRLKEFALEYRPRRMGSAKGARIGTILRTFMDLVRFRGEWPGVPAGCEGRVFPASAAPGAR
jgi:glycosyltransferase involved in cell wall biosynthesis